ncbi:hypothetical protein NW768_010976 [Fusarium equiseti]|uniref:Heterokaryon incompatibility domain-containing protein n=1 Tax=Fusarium equiseti TaxID=61235 RepID=A0ABQ8QZS3_FUSEQ|nr:hypothetical protein NW768_010976 [Fusarium equiseti]
MWLINTKTLELEEFLSLAPSYAILSHTWEKEEVTFVDWQYNLPEARKKSGFRKIHKSCEQALKDGHSYLWCDTNCIDKRSSAELSEAINSMFKWYQNSAICYAYLADVPPGDMSSFSASRWFTRGWTLQELLAPKSLTFYANDWSELGTRSLLSRRIFNITKIRKDRMGEDIFQASISERMSWVSNRETSRTEDIAYCMLGIFGINMPLLYGEGEKAFLRLQEEIIRVSNDQSIFCWHWSKEHVPINWASMLSPSPKAFENSGSYHMARGADDSLSYSISNSGLFISLKLLNVASVQTNWMSTGGVLQGGHLAVLDVNCGKTSCPVAIALQKRPANKRFVRHPFPPHPHPMPIDNFDDVKPTMICVVGPRDRGFMTLLPRKILPSIRYEILVAATSLNSVKFVTTTPAVQLHPNALALRSFTSTFFGVVFALTLTGSLPAEFVTVFCFVGVEDEKLVQRRHCEILETQSTLYRPNNIKSLVDGYESRIIQAVRSLPSSVLRTKSRTKSRMKIAGSEEFWMYSGPWVQGPDDCRLSAVHIAVPKLTSSSCNCQRRLDGSVLG